MVEFDLNLLADDSNWVTADIAARLSFVQVGAAANTESPVMNSASDHISFNDAMRQRRTSVRTRILDGKERSGNVEYTEGQLVDQNHSGLADWDVADFANVDKFWHIFCIVVNGYRIMDRD